jgi:hypothetical protein
MDTLIVLVQANKTPKHLVKEIFKAGHGLGYFQNMVFIKPVGHIYIDAKGRSRYQKITATTIYPIHCTRLN